jgi:cytochrome c peroxidase
MKRSPTSALLSMPVLLWIAAVGGCSQPTETTAPQLAPIPKEEMLGREPLKPLPTRVSDVRLANLGLRLFQDKELSSDNTVACSSCHDLGRGGADGRKYSIGVQGRLGGVNAPTVFNSGLNFVQFWNGRASTLEEQVDGPLTNPAEMSSNWDAVLPKLRRDASYSTDFAVAFSDGVTADNVRKAIAEFERSLLTHGSPFDRWLQGDEEAMGQSAKAGYNLFKTVGCVACHQGANVGGNMFQRFGVFSDYFADRGSVTDSDYGRYNVTHNETDRFVFRVPSLRLAAHTAPYFHDGSADTLTEAVQLMAYYQLGRELTLEQVPLIVEFLQSLSPPATTVGVP